MKNSWRDIVGRPFMGWAFVINIAIAWILLQVVKAIFSSNGIILGAIPATALLFLLAWLVGLPRVLNRTVTKIEIKTPEPKQETKTDRKKLFKILGGLALFFVAWYALVEYNDSKGFEQYCTQVIDFNGSVYKMKDEEVFQDAPRFRTYDEAMNYCKIVAKRLVHGQ